MANTDKQQEMLRMLSKKLGQSPEQIRESAASGNIEGLLGKMNPKEREKAASLLNDPEATKKLLENPQVQALIKKLNGNG